MLQKLWGELLAWYGGEDQLVKNKEAALLGEVVARLTAIEAHLIANNDSLPYKYAPPPIPADSVPVASTEAAPAIPEQPIQAASS
jgi:hypothetical protein